MKFVKTAVMAVGLLFLAQGAAFAQAGPAGKAGFSDLRAIGAGLVIAALLLLGGTFFLGYQFGTHGDSTAAPAAP